jgi:hypothetical protein
MNIKSRSKLISALTVIFMTAAGSLLGTAPAMATGFDVGIWAWNPTLPSPVLKVTDTAQSSPVFSDQGAITPNERYVAEAVDGTYQYEALTTTGYSVTLKRIDRANPSTIVTANLGSSNISGITDIQVVSGKAYFYTQSYVAGSAVAMWSYNFDTNTLTRLFNPNNYQYISGFAISGNTIYLAIQDTSVNNSLTFQLSSITTTGTDQTPAFISNILQNTNLNYSGSYSYNAVNYPVLTSANNLIMKTYTVSCSGGNCTVGNYGLVQMDPTAQSPSITQLTGSLASSTGTLRALNGRLFVATGTAIQELSVNGSAVTAAPWSIATTYTRFNVSSALTPSGLPSDALPCVAGTYSQTGYSSVTNSWTCTQAPAGSYVSTVGATAPTQCAPGYFAANMGSIACAPAQANYFVASYGAAAATPCPANTHSASAATSCIPNASQTVDVRPAPSVKFDSIPTFTPGADGTVTLKGSDLNTYSSVSIGATAGTVSSSTDTGVTFKPAAPLAPGAYDIVLKTAGGGSLTIQGGYVVAAPVVAPVVTPAPAINTEIHTATSVATLSGITASTKVTLNAAQKAVLVDAVKQNEAKTLTCVGLTSKAISSAVATARANAACNYAASLNPGLKTTVSVQTVAAYKADAKQNSVAAIVAPVVLNYTR